MEEEQLEEYLKCKSNPYYFATKYMVVDGKPFTTLLTEKEFNKMIKHRFSIWKANEEYKDFQIKTNGGLQY